jgi:RNA polymerase sigma factor (sigma-70 family)
MTTTAFSDAELLAQARQGDEAAFTELYVRHHAAAKRVASAYPRAGDPEDLVNGAFERVLGALRRGAGPDEAFRAYLFVTLRRFAADQINRSHDEPVDEVPEPVRAEELTPELDVADRQLVVSAYESLPERWQAVLWQTAVEGHQPRELAGVLGMSANAAAALAYRAREKLRQAYLQAHLQTAPRPQCEPHRSRLGAYVRDGLSRRDKGATDSHLDDCESCRSLVAELVDVNRLLVRSLFPLFQAVATHAGAAVVAGGALASGGGAALLGRRLISKLRSNPTVVAGVVVAAALALALVALRGDEQAQPRGAAPEVEEAAEPPDSPPPEPSAPAVSPQAEPQQEPPLLQPDRPPPSTPTPSTPEPTTEPPAMPETPDPEPPPVPPSTPVPPTTPVPSTQPPTIEPPGPPALVVVWLEASADLRITLTNNTGRPTDGLLVEVDVAGGALITGRPSGCGVSLSLIWSATCSVLPLHPGQSVVIEVPVRVTAPGQVATTQVCESGLLSLDCLGSLVGRITTALLG